MIDGASMNNEPVPRMVANHNLARLLDESQKDSGDTADEHHSRENDERSRVQVRR
jgi:hypothetical protein